MYFLVAKNLIGKLKSNISTWKGKLNFDSLRVLFGPYQIWGNSSDHQRKATGVADLCAAESEEPYWCRSVAGAEMHYN